MPDLNIHEYDEEDRAVVKINPGSRVAWISSAGTIDSTVMRESVLELPRVDPARIAKIAPSFEEAVAALSEIHGPVFAARWATGEVGAAFSEGFDQGPSVQALDGITRMVE